MIKQSNILWRQVWGLAALLGAIVFCWLAYGYYQPIILTKLGWVELATTLGIIQGFLAVIVEPLVGLISDRILRNVGSRLPIITTGVTLAGLIFVILSLLLGQDLPIGLRWLVPVLMTIWVIAMIIFRGPAIALLRQFAPTQDLPQANAILTLVFCLVGAFGPLISVIIENLGISITFGLGAIVLLAGATLLYSAPPALPIFSEMNSPDNQVNHPSILVGLNIFLVGLGIGIVVNLLLRELPIVFSPNIINLPVNYLSAGILLIAAITALPLEKLTIHWGMGRSMIFSILFIYGFWLISLIIKNTFLATVVIILCGSAFGLLTIAQIPYILNIWHGSSAGLATGLYFGGMGGATSIISLILWWRKTWIITLSLSLGLFGVITTIVSIALIRHHQRLTSNTQVNRLL